MSHVKSYHFTSNHASSKKIAVSKFDILLSEINDDDDSTIRTNLKCGGDFLCVRNTERSGASRREMCHHTQSIRKFTNVHSKLGGIGLKLIISAACM